MNEPSRKCVLRALGRKLQADKRVRKWDFQTAENTDPDRARTAAGICLFEHGHYI